MSKKSIKNYLFMSIMIVCMITGTIGAHGSSAYPLTPDLTKRYEEMKNIQKQLYALAEAAYSDKVEHKSNEESKKILKFLSTQIDEIIANLDKEKNLVKEDKIEATEIQVLSTSANILKYMKEALMDYMNAEGYVEQLQFLRIYFKLDGVVNQLNIDFEYFGNNTYLKSKYKIE